MKRNKTPFKNLHHLLFCSSPNKEGLIIPWETTTYNHSLKTIATNPCSPFSLPNSGFKSNKANLTEKCFFSGQNAQNFRRKPKENKKEDLFSDKTTREDMKSSALIKFLSNRKKTFHENKTPKERHFFELEPQINQKTVNSICNQSFDDKRENSNEDKSQLNLAFKFRSPILIKNEINKKLLQKIIRRKMQNSSVNDPSAFLQNFKYSRDFNKRIFDFEAIKKKIMEDCFPKPARTNPKEEVSITYFEDSATNFETQTLRIERIKKQTKEARYRLYALTIKIKEGNLEKDRIERKFEKKIREVKDQTLENKKKSISSIDISDKKQHEIQNFLKISNFEEEKNRQVEKISKTLTDSKKEINLLKTKVEECESEIQDLKNKRDLLLYETKSKLNIFLLKNKEEFDFVKIFKIFVRMDFQNFFQFLLEFLDRKTIEFYHEITKKKIEIERLLQEKKKLKPEAGSSADFLNSVEEKCKNLQKLFSGGKNDLRSRSVNNQDRKLPKFQPKRSISPIDLSQNQKRKEIDKKIMSIEAEIQGLECAYIKELEGKNKFKSFHH